MPLRSKPSSLLLASIFAVGALGLSRPAQACGGFWCSQSAPVNQTAERIIFVAHQDGTTTCAVEIQYAGPSEKFAWVLPVQGVPKVSVSSNVALDRLSAATQPQYVLERHVSGECDPSPMLFAMEDGNAVDAVASPSAGGVEVLAEGSVGPYDYVVIRPDSTLPEPAQVAIDWLNTEGYDIAGISSEVLGPYLADGMNLIAFRLSKGNDAGAIRPVIIDYVGDLPAIPIRPTAVAAQDDMGVLVWVMGPSQAVPQNYRSLVLNEALINWFNPLSNYDEVVTAAANEAGGQGFVTEMADASGAVDEVIFSASDDANFTRISQQSYADPLDMIWDANSYYRSWDGWRDAIEAAVSLPPGGTYDEFGRNPDVYRGVPGFGVDTQVFLDRLSKDVVEPVRQTQLLVDSQPYMTRLYTTMSAEEMTTDPVFTFNPDLAPVSNVHTADIYIECQAGIYESEAPWRIELPQGGTLTGEGQQGSWPLALDGAMPANRKIVQLSESGPGVVIEDSSADIQSTIVEGGGMASPPTSQPSSGDAGVPIGGEDEPLAPMGAGVSTTQSSGGCGCAMPGAPARGDAAALVGLLGLGLLRRRRR